LNLTREEAIKDTIKTATKTNKAVNKSLIGTKLNKGIEFVYI